MENYKKIQLVGKGNFGCAVLVQLTQNRKYYIMKVIDILRLDQRQRQDALNEVKFLKELQHPFIIAYRESFIDKDRFLCIIMDYCEGGDLHNQIMEQKKTGQGFTEQQILDWFVQICFGLKFIHDRRILHRDLKTQNIFLTSQKEIKIGDFGIAKVLQNTCEMAKTAIGTPYYLSPEICQQKPYNQKTDIWSLGCILYELATLRHAFDAKYQQALVLKILKGSYPSIPSCYSPQLSELIGEMLQKQPTKRPSVKKILEKPFLSQTINKLLQNSIQSVKDRVGNTSHNDALIIQQMADSFQQNIERPLARNDENISPLLQQQQQQNVQEQSKQNIVGGASSSLTSSFLRQLSNSNQIQNQQPQLIASNCDNIIQQQKLQYLQNQQEYQLKQANPNQINLIQNNPQDLKTPIQERKLINQQIQLDQQQSSSLAEIKSQFPSFQQNLNGGQQQQQQILNKGIINNSNYQQNIIKSNIQYSSNHTNIPSVNNTNISAINNINNQSVNNIINQDINCINKIINPYLPNNAVRQSSLSRCDSPGIRQNNKNIIKAPNPLRKSFDSSADSNISNSNLKNNIILPQNISNQNNYPINYLPQKSSNKLISPQYSQNILGQNIPQLNNINQIIRSSQSNIINPQVPSSSLSSLNLSSSRRQSGGQTNQPNLLPQNQSSSQIQNISLPLIPQPNQISNKLTDQHLLRDNPMNQLKNPNQQGQKQNQNDIMFNKTQQSDSDEDFEEPEDQRVKCEFLGIDGKIIPGMSEKDSIFNRIEALKVYLEKNIGEDLFIEVYQELQDENLNDTEQGKRLNKLLNSSQQKFIPLIYQMIFCEDSYYTNL